MLNSEIDAERPASISFVERARLQSCRKAARNVRALAPERNLTNNRKSACHPDRSGGICSCPFVPSALATNAQFQIDANRPASVRFVKGHDSSRAAKPQETSGLQPLRDTSPKAAARAPVIPTEVEGSAVPRHLCPPNNAQIQIDANTPASSSFVKGHDFSRAAKAAKTTRASAPERYLTNNGKKCPS